MKISFLPDLVPASEVGVHCHFVFSEVTLWLLGATLPSLVHLNPLHLHSKPSWSGQKLFVTECDLSATCHHQLTPLEQGFPPQMPQKHPLVISHSLRVGGKNCPLGWIWWFWGAASGCSWRIPVWCPRVIYPSFLSLHGAFPIMDPAGMALQGSGDGDRGCRDRRWLLSLLCKLWEQEKRGTIPPK